MRSMVTALESSLSNDSLFDQSSIDRLAYHVTANPLRTSEKDWRLMGKKVYTPINLCQDYLYQYEQFIIGQITLQPCEIIGLVEDTFKKLNECLIPVKISSKDDNTSKSQLAITYQRMFTRTMRNVSAGKIHTYSAGVQPISIDIDWNDGSVLTSPKD